MASRPCLRLINFGIKPASNGPGLYKAKIEDISSKEEFHERFKNHVSELEAIYGAMKFAHEKGWIHRDLKPENIVFKIDEMTKVLIRDEDIDFEDVDIIKVKNLFKQGIKEEDDDDLVFDDDPKSESGTVDDDKVKQLLDTLD